MKTTSRLGSAPRGFTLIELLVSITIIAVLASLAYGAYGKVMQQGRMAKEIAAAKLLANAYAAYTTDHAGQLMPGYDRTVGALTLQDGNVVGGPTAQRYPYRLAPYFDYKLEGSILVNGNAQTIDPGNTYMVSCFPALGMNYIFVGGDVSSAGVMTFASDCLTNISQAVTSPLIFASAGSQGEDSGGGSGKMEGYCILTPPQQTGPMWSTAAWTKDSSPESYGHVDARYNGKAVCAFLDGAVRVLTLEEMRDMRLWSNNAAAANNKDYTVSQPAPPAGGGRPRR